MACKDELVHEIKNEPNVDITDITHVKVENNYSDMEIKVGNIKDVKPEHEHEILPKIKQEEIYLKDATPTAASQPSGSKQYDDLPLKCTIKQSFDRILQKHTQSFLLSKKRTPQFPYPNKIRQKPTFYCALCQYKANKKVNLKRHMTIHTSEKRFVCNSCNFKTGDRSNLIAHMRIHTGDKPFACNLCEYKSAQKGGLTGHMKVHTGEKLFSCDFCKFKSAYKHGLVKHMRIHTGEKPYECNVCEFKANQRSNLKAHMKIHLGKKLKKPMKTNTDKKQFHV